jgi:hypothetical protein
MLFPVCYIVPLNLCQQTSLPLVSGTYAIEVDHSDEASLISAYQQVSQLPIQQSFCLFIRPINELSKRQADDIIAFFFFPNYYKAGQKPLLLSENNGALQDSSFGEMILQQAKAHGYHQQELKFINTNTNPADTICKASDGVAIIQITRRLLQDSSSFTEMLYIKADRVEDILNAQSILDQEEQVFKEQNPRLYGFMVKNKELTASVEHLEQMVEAAGQELLSQAAHMKVLRSSSQATHLQHYYNNEYEVLPSWYKQFGHVLKVVLGKRSFRSLFNDNVKKYKQ